MEEVEASGEDIKAVKGGVFSELKVLLLRVVEEDSHMQQHVGGALTGAEGAVQRTAV